MPIQAFRNHGLSPDRPCIRGTAQNPDVFFQAREACNAYYDRTPGIVQEAMNRFAGITGRQYRLFDYAGHPQAERVLVIMGSGGETAQQTAEWLNQHGEKTGVLESAPLPAIFGRSFYRGAACRPRAALPCSTAPRNRAPSANRFMWMS